MKVECVRLGLRLHFARGFFWFYSMNGTGTAAKFSLQLRHFLRSAVLVEAESYTGYVV